jgi:hypothetical protein
MRFIVRGSLEFRQSLDQKFFLSSSVVTRRKDYWTFEVDDGQASESFAATLKADRETRALAPQRKHSPDNPNACPICAPVRCEVARRKEQRR